jgi:hypothetical protein
MTANDIASELTAVHGKIDPLIDALLRLSKSRDDDYEKLSDRLIDINESTESVRDQVSELAKEAEADGE